MLEWKEDKSDPNVLVAKHGKVTLSIRRRDDKEYGIQFAVFQNAVSGNKRMRVTSWVNSQRLAKEHAEGWVQQQEAQAQAEQAQKQQ